MWEKLNLKVLNLKRKRKRYIDLFLDITPESKRAMGKKQSKIQKIIIEQMKIRGYKKITSEVAIEITVYSSEKTPPRIEKFVKNLLDLMHKKEILQDAADADFLPFEEDRDVKYLSVKYIFLSSKSSVVIHIRPFSSFISDIHFVDAEIKENRDKHDADDFNSVKEHYKHLIEEEEKYVKVFSKEVYSTMLDFAVLDMQKSLASVMAISPFIIGLIYPKKGRGTKTFKKVYKDWATYLIDFPIRIKLPEIPTQKDTSAKYIADIKRQLSSYIEKRFIFRNLKAPVAATVFYSPPVGKKGFYKDVDNIMREYILPSFNDVFSPPLSLFNLGMKKDDEFSKVIPKSLNGSAIGYTIIELPKKYSEPEKGYLSVGFEIVDLYRDGIIQSLNEKIESYIENNKYIS